LVFPAIVLSLSKDAFMREKIYFSQKRRDRSSASSGQAEIAENKKIFS